MPFTIGDAFIELRPSLASGFDQAVASSITRAVSLSGIEDRVEQLGSRLTKSLTLGIGAGTVASQAQFAGLDAALAETVTLFSAVGDRADDLWDEFRGGVNEASDAVGQFERTISAGLYQAISAGVPRDNVFSFLEVAGEAAIGGVLEVESAVSGLTTAVNAFYGGDFTRAQEASDIFFRTVARGKTTFDELQSSMARSAPIAQAAGVSFEEFSAIAATMTLSGTRTEEAMTNIKAALTGLLRPTEQMTAIFQNAGFASQDLAIQTLGAQGAMQVLAEAVDYNVGSLITLLGGAEAANAVLQVTGDNAGKFASILNDVSTATGATSAAFSIMDDTAQATFRRFGVATDQLGSSLGEIGFQVVGPLTRGFTSVVEVTNSVAEAFTGASGAMRFAFNAAVTFTAALGPMLLIASKLVPILTFGLAKGLVTSVGAFGALRLSAQVAGGAVAGLAARITRFIPGLGGLTGGLVAARTRGLAPLTDMAQRSALRFIGWTAVIIAAGTAYEHVRKSIESSIDSYKFASDQAEVLADSLGLVVKPFEQLQEGAVVSVTFRTENAAIIDELRHAEDEGILENRLIQIAYRLQALGNPIEDVEEAIRRLAMEAGVEIPVGFRVDDATFAVTKQAVLADVNQLGIDAALTFGDALNTSIVVPGTEFSRQVDQFLGEVEQLGEFAGDIWQQEGPEAAIEFLRRIDAEVLSGIDSATRRQEVEDRLTEAFANRVDVERNLFSRGLFGTRIGRADFADIERLLEEDIERWEARAAAAEESEVAAERALLIPGAPIAGPIRTEEEITEGQARLAEFTRQSQERRELVLQERESVQQGLGQLDSFIAEVQRNIAARLEEISASLLSQMPVWGEYQGAAEIAIGNVKDELDVNDIIGSLEAFNEGIRAWQELNAELVGKIPEQLRARLGELPLEQRAGLAQLADEHPSEFQRILDAYEESFNLQQDVAEDAYKVELPGIVEEGNQLIIDKAEEIRDELGPIGAGAAEDWAVGFVSQRYRWLAAINQLKMDLGILELPIPVGVPGAVTERPPAGTPTPRGGGAVAGFAPQQQYITEEFNFGDILITEQVQDATRLSEALFRQIEQRVSRRSRERVFVE